MSEQDTREQLNEELMDSCLTFADHGGHLRAFSYVSELLDRQAAITTAECTSEDESFCEACRAVQKRKLAELTVERDKLQAELDELVADGVRVTGELVQAENKQQFLQDECDRWQRHYAAINKNYMHLGDKYREMCAERDEWKAKAEQAERAMNRAAGKWAKAESRSAKRAEAVERLRQLPPMDTSGMRYVRAMLGSVVGMTAQDVVAELIELLEDDELTAERDELQAALKRERVEWESERDYANQCEERLNELKAERDQLSRDLTAEHALVCQFEDDNERLKKANRIQAESFRKLEIELAMAKGGAE